MSWICANFEVGLDLVRDTVFDLVLTIGGIMSDSGSCRHASVQANTCFCGSIGKEELGAVGLVDDVSTTCIGGLDYDLLATNNFDGRDAVIKDDIRLLAVVNGEVLHLALDHDDGSLAVADEDANIRFFGGRDGEFHHLFVTALFGLVLLDEDFLGVG